MMLLGFIKGGYGSVDKQEGIYGVFKSTLEA